MSLRMIVPAVAILSLPQGASEGFVCVPEMATGFRYDSAGARWVSASFVTNNRYVVTRSTSSRLVWEVKVTGNTAPIAFCEKDFEATSGYLDCEGFERFMMNRKTLRFMTAYLVGYWTDNPSAQPGKIFAPASDTPHLQIGRCSPL